MKRRKLSKKPFWEVSVVIVWFCESIPFWMDFLGLVRKALVTDIRKHSAQDWSQTLLA